MPDAALGAVAYLADAVLGLAGSTRRWQCRPWLVSVAISLILIYWAYDEVWSSIVYLRRVWRHTRSARELWNVFWGRYSAAGEAVALTLRLEA